MPVPRLRVFAGPKGSGKSTIKRILAPELIYAHVNADDLERKVNDRGAIDLTPFKIDCAQDVFRTFFSQHPSKINRDAHGTESDRYPTCSALPSTPVFKSTSCTLPPSHLQRAKQVPLLRAMLPHAEQHVI